MKTQKEKYLNVLYPIYELLGVKENTRSVKCPNPEHPDKHPSAILKNNNVYCYSCQRFFHVSDLIEYKNLSIDLMYEDLRSMYGEDIKEEYENKNNSEVYQKREIKEIKRDGLTIAEYTKKFFMEN